MTGKDTPRVRTLLRQAERTAASGKLAAAEQLYRQIIEEAPESPAAWLGLAGVLYDEAAREEAYQNALSLDPGNETAQLELARLRGEIEPEEIIEEVIEIEEKAVEAADLDEEDEDHDVIVTGADSHDLMCYRHPNRQTSLRCNKCGKPICIKCAKKTSVGYRCQECLRDIEAGYYTATLLEYALAIMVTIPLAALASSLASAVGFFAIFLSAIAGDFIGRIIFRVVRRRRGRWLPHTVAAAVVVGSLIRPLIGILIVVAATALGEEAVGLGLAGFAMGGFLWPGIFAVLAAGAAYYRMR
jgi:tetratricopeptide (TPR) repeat protein